MFSFSSFLTSRFDKLIKIIQINKFKLFLLKFLKNFAVLFLGIFFVFVFLELSLFVLGQVQKLSLAQKSDFSKKDEFVILCLGESTTASMERWGKDYSWPFFLEKLLNAAGLEKKVKVINEGIIGVNSNIILTNLDENLEKYKPDLVISMMGINDYGDVAFETSAGIENNNLKSKSRVYKLIKFLLTNIKNKYYYKFKEKLVCHSEESCSKLASAQSLHNPYETEQAKTLWNKVLEYNSTSSDALTNLGFVYLSPYSKDETKAMEYFQKSLEYDPENARTYFGYINSIFNIPNSEVEIEKIKVDIKHYKIKDKLVFSSLADYELYHGDKNRLIYLQEALDVAPNNTYTLHNLAKYYVQHENLEEAEKIYLKILKSDQIDEMRSAVLIELAQLYQKTNKETLADELFKQAYASNDIYIQNYQKLYEKLQSREIKLIAVQYPMRNIKPLETIFKDKNEVILVDNELNFRNLVQKEGYNQVFLDSFAGDFGHCTKLGNQLLAKNIKSVVVANWSKLINKN